MNNDAPGSPPSIREETGALQLPADIWIEVIDHLKPSHVLSLGQTCRILRETLNVKAIWVKTLRTVSQRHGLFLATYPFEKMDLPHLQRAAMGPELYARMINRHGVLPRDLESARSVPLAVSPPHEWKVVTSHLVPGGRFLVTILDAPTGEVAGSITVSVWDLGVPGALPRPSPVELGSHKFQERSRRVMSLVGCVVDGSRIRIAFRSEHQHVQTFRVFTITLGEMGSEFEETASIRLEGYMRHQNYVLTSERIILLVHQPNKFLVWKYMSNQYAIWIAEHDASFETINLRCFRQYLVYSCPSLQSLVLWDLSALDVCLEPVPIPPASVSLRSGHGTAPTLTKLVIPSPWAGTHKGQFGFLAGTSSSAFPGELIVGTTGCFGSLTYRWYAVNVAAGLPPEPKTGLIIPLAPNKSEPTSPTIAGAAELTETPVPSARSPYRLLAESHFPEWAAQNTSNLSSNVFFRSDGVCDIFDFGTGTRGGYSLFSPLSEDLEERGDLKIASLPDRADYILKSVCLASGRALSMRFSDAEENEPYIRLLEYI